VILLRGAAVLADFLASAALSELKLDRESDPIYSRNREFHLPKCPFHFFDPTVVHNPRFLAAND
jgi:hypothetical protein